VDYYQIELLAPLAQSHYTAADARRAQQVRALTDISIFIWG
jgi:hypothetical protein